VHVCIALPSKGFSPSPATFWRSLFLAHHTTDLSTRFDAGPEFDFGALLWRLLNSVDLRWTAALWKGCEDRKESFQYRRLGRLSHLRCVTPFYKFTASFEFRSSRQWSHKDSWVWKHPFPTLGKTKIFKSTGKVM
jgi:hypothetical protein